MKQFRGYPPIPRLIVSVTTVFMAAGLGAVVHWWHTAQAALLVAFFHYPGALFLVAMSAVELWLSWICWRQLLRGDAIRPAWFLIMLAAAAHLTGTAFSQLLGVESYLNPLVYCDKPGLGAAADFLHQTGLLISGPLQMTLLACGLALVVRINRRAGLLPRLSRSDWLLTSVLVAYTLRDAWQVILYLRLGKVLNGFEVISWTSDPLLIVLLFEAICIRRVVLGMGRGLIAKCWGAFATAITLTALGDISLWAKWNEYLPEPLASLSWLVWFVAGAAYALGPAYQVEAFRRVHESAYFVVHRRPATLWASSSRVS